MTDPKKVTTTSTPFSTPPKFVLPPQIPFVPVERHEFPLNLYSQPVIMPPKRGIAGTLLMTMLDEGIIEKPDGPMFPEPEPRGDLSAFFLGPWEDLGCDSEEDSG